MRRCGALPWLLSGLQRDLFLRSMTSVALSAGLLTAYTTFAESPGAAVAATGGPLSLTASRTDTPESSMCFARRHTLSVALSIHFAFAAKRTCTFRPRGVRVDRMQAEWIGAKTSVENSPVTLRGTAPSEQHKSSSHLCFVATLVFLAHTASTGVKAEASSRVGTTVIER